MNDQIRLIKLITTPASATLTITGEEQPLTVPINTVLHHRLVEGIVITMAQLDMLHEEAELYRCDRQVARLLAMRDHSVGELKAKLRQRTFSTSVVQSTLRKYIDSGALDDSRYAMASAQSLLLRRPCGRGYLCAYLQKRKISRDLAEQTAEALLDAENPDDLAVTALEQRWSRFEQLELETARSKAYNYLARRGFGYAPAKAAFEKLWRETRETSEESENQNR
ncbi:MAG: RecX family transcriptional regulator [candidate division Zixibacteria bacterium]|nr:RecX family transcriptional regulator [candidate division Zixibacteria bacterium]MDH3937851.1 RecX family transcriptional regulator [candidate division Zixibacteria bacterium]MDH4032310.1 RecX family transcriptional regulator [candidate division Zixibacteria bacterium]